MQAFSNEEAEWLVSNSKVFILFGSSAKIAECRAILCLGSKGYVQYELVYRRSESGSVWSDTESRGTASCNLDRQSVVNSISGRGGPDIEKEQTMHFLGSGSCTFTTIIVDVQSYYSVMKRRSGDVSQAKQQTLAYLNSVVLFYRDNKYMLELFLLSNLHVQNPETWKTYKTIYRELNDGKIDDPVFQMRIISNCEKYRNKVRDLINKLD